MKVTGKAGLQAVVLISAMAALLAGQTVTTDTVFVNVRVTDSKKVPAVGLKAENFQIWEDGIEQKISSFSATDGPWDIGFKPTSVGKTNTWRKLKIQLTPPAGQNLKANIKDKYFVPKP